jgi:hypothetical protein
LFAEKEWPPEKKYPFGPPLGEDCFESIKEKCEETLRTLEEWKDVITSTSHDEIENWILITRSRSATSNAEIF